MVKSPWTLTKEMFLSEKEADRLTAQLTKKRKAAKGKERHSLFTDEFIVTGLMHSGLRNSEFCNLAIADTILGTKESSFRVTGTRQDRTVHVSASLSRLVKSYVASCQKRFGPPQEDVQPLVLNERGRRFDRTSLYRRVVRILKDVELGERASVQLLRHTYGYLAYKRSGGNLLFVQRQLGHSHPMVTSVYAKFVDENYAQLANTISGNF